MSDYVRPEFAYLIGSDPEPTHWPHDPEKRIETVWHRISWSDLRDRFQESAHLVEQDRPAYDQMSHHARTSMTGYAHKDVVVERLKRAFCRLEV